MHSKPDRAAWGLLAALTALNVLSFIDRQLVVALAPLLMAELGLSRAQIGILVGVSFIVVFAFVMLVLGAAADRLSRPRLIAAGLAVWSIGTALSGAARSFSQMAVLRLVVGVGEAALSPAALSMLGDRFPASRLGLAGGVFYAGIPVGFAISFLLAGWIGPWLGWRACFYALGLFGLLAVAGAAALSDPQRSGISRVASKPRPVEVARALLRHLAAHPKMALVCLGAAGLGFMSSASQHTITWLVEERGVPYARAAFLSAAITASAGLTGNLALGLLADWCHRRHQAGRLGGLAAAGAVALACAAAFYVVPPSSVLFFPGWFVAQAFMMGWFGPVMAEVHRLSPPDLKATGLGFGLLTVNLLGVATGPWVTGVIGDRASLTHGLLGSLAVGACALVLMAWAALTSVPTPPADTVSAS